MQSTSLERRLLWEGLSNLGFPSFRLRSTRQGRSRGVLFLEGGLAKAPGKEVPERQQALKSAIAAFGTDESLRAPHLVSRSKGMKKSKNPSTLLLYTPPHLLLCASSVPNCLRMYPWEPLW